VETSGPEYNDRDPLLGYQLDQAAKGNPESEYAVAIRYLTGNGVPRDPQLGREWLEKSSAHGNLRACAKLRELQHGKNS
jgi:TPR repeat protein